MNQSIIVIAEHIEGKITPLTHELIAAARVLSHLSDISIKIIIPGNPPSDTIQKLSEQSGLDILIITSDSRTSNKKIIPYEWMLKNLSEATIKDLHPKYICMAHNTRGLDAAPGLAVKMDAACITAVEKITRREKDIFFTRSIFNDKIKACIISSAKTSVLTICPGIFTADSNVAKTAGKISTLTLPDPADACPVLASYPSPTDTAALKNAKVIVAAGNGIKEKENLAVIYQLAEIFPKSAVAGSRPICDKKWLSYSQQIGITGATVQPDLYIACGISGAGQHISGMRESKFIVSINTDPHAAIFNISDICVVEDLAVFIPELRSACQDFFSKQ